MCDLSTIHYLILPHKLISCGKQDRVMRHTLELSEVTCPECMEIEMNGNGYLIGCSYEDMIESGIHRDEMKKEGN